MLTSKQLSRHAFKQATWSNMLCSGIRFLCVVLCVCVCVCVCLETSKHSSTVVSIRYVVPPFHYLTLTSRNQLTTGFQSHSPKLKILSRVYKIKNKMHCILEHADFVQERKTFANSQQRCFYSEFMIYFPVSFYLVFLKSIFHWTLISKQFWNWYHWWATHV
jgi:hypothetical protein